MTIKVKRYWRLTETEWKHDELPIDKPVYLHETQWYLIDGTLGHVTLTLTGVDENGKLSDAYGYGFTIGEKDYVFAPVTPGTDMATGMFFCLLIDGKEYWKEDIEKNRSFVETTLNDYNTELYLKEIDDD